MSETLRCRICDQERPVNEFALYPGKPGQRIALCRSCRSERQRAHMLGTRPKPASGPLLPPLDEDWAPPAVPDVASIKARLLAASRKGARP